MSASIAQLPPLDPEPARTMADADLRRRERYLRKLLAEGGFTQARVNLINVELHEVQAELRQREGR